MHRIERRIEGGELLPVGDERPDSTFEGVGRRRSVGDIGEALAHIFGRHGNDWTMVWASDELQPPG